MKFVPVTINYDEPVNAVRDVRRLNRAQKRHDDTTHTRRNRDMWFNKNRWDITPNENGNYSNWNKGIVKHNAQSGRFSKFSTGHKRNSYKLVYKSPDVELANYFERIDERMEQISDKKSESFALWLIEQDQNDLKAGELLDEFNAFVLDNLRESSRLYDDGCVPYIDCNCPGVVYYVDPECIHDFRMHMCENGACIIICPQHDSAWQIKHVTGVRRHRHVGLIFE